MKEVFDTPELITALADYSEPLSNQEDKAHLTSQSPPTKDTDARNTSLLFLQVYSAADYFTMNKSLMVASPPVLVDLSECPLT